MRAFDTPFVRVEQAGAPLREQPMPADPPVGGLAAYVRSCNRCMETGKQQAAGGFAHVAWSTKQRWVCEACLPTKADVLDPGSVENSMPARLSARSAKV